MIKVGYDAGHGLHTPGKRTPDGEREWTFNDIVARAFAAELAMYNDVETKRFDDPSGKTDVPLATRTNNANKWGATVFVSIHQNAHAGTWGSHTGVETYVYTGHQPKSLAVAEAIHPALVQAFGLRDRGIKRKNLHMLRETKMPCVLVEGGFMDSTIDIHKLRDRNVLESAGKLMAQALAKHYKLTRRVLIASTRPPSTPTPTQDVSSKIGYSNVDGANTFRIQSGVYNGKGDAAQALKDAQAIAEDVIASGKFGWVTIIGYKE